MLKNRLEYGLIFAVSVALFLFYHNFFFFYLMLTVILIPFVSFFVTRKISEKVSVSVSIPVISVNSGNDIPVDFTVENRSRLPVPGVRAEFTVANNYYPNSEIQEMTLPVRRKTSSYRWSVNSVYAGRIVLKGSKLRLQDYLGLFIFEKDWETECGISVMPNQSDIIMNIIENTFTQGDEQENDSSRTTDDVTQIKEFREYRPGDRMQRVNWKITARRDEVYVKEFEQEYNRTLTLLVELRRDSEEIGFLDELITAFYSAAVKLIDMEMNFRVQWYDCESGRFMTEAVNDPDGLDDALRQMYLMKSYPECSALAKYREEPHGMYDTAIYFTPGTFAGNGSEERIGTFKERVMLVCL